jgi:trans-aconitate methyltransferase
MAIPERLRWAVETLAVRPDDRVLELGCGTGVAVSLVCDRLATGTITAVDRSAKAIAQAERRNAAHVTSGRAAFRTESLEDLPPGGAPYDKVFAVNVNLFWTKDPAPELALLRSLLTPTGSLHLVYEPPTAEKAESLARTVRENLERSAFTVETATAETGGSTLLSLKATVRGVSR